MGLTIISITAAVGLALLCVHLFLELRSLRAQLDAPADVVTLRRKVHAYRHDNRALRADSNRHKVAARAARLAFEHVSDRLDKERTVGAC